MPLRRKAKPSTIKRQKYCEDQTYYTVQKLVDAKKEADMKDKKKTLPGKGFDIAKMARFLRKLSIEPVESKAARLVNVPGSTLQRWKNDIPGFKEEMEKAKEGVIEVLIAKAFDLALGRDGKVSEKLLIKLLERYDPRFKDGKNNPLVQMQIGLDKNTVPVFNINFGDNQNQVEDNREEPKVIEGEVINDESESQ